MKLMHVYKIKSKKTKSISNNISGRDLVNIRELNVLPIKTLWQIAKLRNINSSMSKSSIILALLHSEPVINERKYIINNVNEIHSKINDIRLQLFQVSPYMDKKEHSKIRKRLYDIKKITKINRSLKNKLLKELNSISIDLKFIYKNMISDYRDDNYANINDIEYIFGDIDDYYTPVLTSLLFDGGYQRFHFRGDKLRNMSVKPYLDNIISYLRMLKIQLDIGFNMTHISDDERRITHFSRSDDVICRPSSDTNEILEQLTLSLYEKYQNDLYLTHESSSFVYESVEECNIHFHKVDLRRGASYIESPPWLQHKKATINPENSNNTYCFMHAIAVSLFHEVLGKNPGRISKRLTDIVNVLNWHQIDFPTTYDDYITFERLNNKVALNVLYVPLNEINICPEYISKYNFDKRHQVVLLKIGDDKGKWHYLALPSNLDEDGFRRPKKSISRLFEGISSKSHGDFY